jgi:hypothetical protein
LFLAAVLFFALLRLSSLGVFIFTFTFGII